MGGAARGRGVVSLAWLLLLATAALASFADEPAQPEVRVDVQPREVTVGDHLSLTIEVTVPPETRLEPPQIGPELGPFSVVDGGWGLPETVDGAEQRVWSGTIVAFRTGEMEVPPLRIVVEAEDGTRVEQRSEPVAVTVTSVLEEGPGESADQELSGLKPPASLPPDYDALFAAAGILALLLAGAGLMWWLHRRYAARLAAVPSPDDPFHRTPPHEWVYAELQKLLERRLAEQGEVQLFFAELSRIVKQYLGGRFRVELMERTTHEVPRSLRQAGAESSATHAVVQLLEKCDMVKFAGRIPVSEECRSAIEAAYSIVDATKPRQERAEQSAQGAA